MTQPVFFIDWSRGRVSWRVERPVRDLPLDPALEVAAERLRKSHAEVMADPAGGVLHFRGTPRSGRSWLACISEGRVEAEQVGDRLSVTIGARVRRLIVWTGLAALVFGVVGA